jgi:hypothetical protein
MEIFPVGSLYFAIALYKANLPGTIDEVVKYVMTTGFSLEILSTLWKFRVQFQSLRVSEWFKIASLRFEIWVDGRPYIIILVATFYNLINYRTIWLSGWDQTRSVVLKGTNLLQSRAWEPETWCCYHLSRLLVARQSVKVFILSSLRDVTIYISTTSQTCPRYVPVRTGGSVGI